jgi:NADH-quinone oxidoreductase subunit L
LAGFFSKDEILADAWAASPLVYGLLSLAAFLTALYIGRQVFLVFGGAPRTQAAEHARENAVVMLAPLGILAGLSLVGGFLNFPGITTLGNWLAATLEEVHAPEFEWLVPGVSVGLSVVALMTAYALYGSRALGEGGTDPLQARLGWIFTALQRKWWVDELYAAAVVRPYVRFATFLAWTVDQDWLHDRFHDGVVASGFRRLTEWLALGFDLPVIDGAARGLASLTLRLAGRLRRVQSGFVRTYALSLLVGSLLLLSYFLLS